MNDLFNMDFGDYNPDGEVFSRPSARAVIYHDGKILLVYSKKYDYYKFPGGGIEKGETPEEALIREVREETGYLILPETIEEYGRVLRRQKDTARENAIFEQENLYYFCEISDDRQDTHLDDYEAGEGFTAVWIDAMTASRHNRHAYHADGVDLAIVNRDARVLDMVDLEIRKRERLKKERLAIAALGTPGYQGMLDYVEDCLRENAEYSHGGKSEITYSRFAHTKRVLSWAKRLYDMTDDKSGLRYEDLMIATIFHDVGRTLAIKNGEPHAKAGVPLTEKYLLAHGFDKERTDYICGLVAGHSDKHRMQEPDLDKNLLMLMEADLLDDMGALGIVMDCMITEARNPEAVFENCLDHIMRYTRPMQFENPMVTAPAKKLWDEKTRIVCEFTDALRRDIEMGE